mmetsp:Transcript_38434/g.101821  ORF Transcript_38434/g.101821 Transcript_38434/m.101821 type:complete len:226 (+) Transcript_38434:169-846(+)
MVMLRTTETLCSTTSGVTMPTPSHLWQWPEPCTRSPRMFCAQPPHSGHPCCARPKSSEALVSTEGARNVAKKKPLPPQWVHLPEPSHVVHVLGCLASQSWWSCAAFRRLSSSSCLSLSSCSRRSLCFFSSSARWRCWSSSCCRRRLASRSSRLLLFSSSRICCSRRCFSASAWSMTHCSFALFCLQRPLPPTRSIWLSGWTSLTSAAPGAAWARRPRSVLYCRRL